MVEGLSRDSRGMVTVLHDHRRMELDEQHYREAGHQPWFDDLPIVEQEEPRL